MTMTPRDLEKIQDPCVLIEAPRFGEAKFYGLWLLAAARAEALWKNASVRRAIRGAARRRYPRFRHRRYHAAIEHSEDFLRRRPTPRTQEMEEWAVMLECVMMAELGFFTLTGDRYQNDNPGAGAGYRHGESGSTEAR